MAEEDCTAIEISAAALYEIYEKDLEQFTIIQMNLADLESEQKFLSAGGFELMFQ